MLVEKPSEWGLQSGAEWGLSGPLFFKYFQQFKEKPMAKPFLSLLLSGYTIAVIMPMHQASTCGWVLAPGQTPRAPKQWKARSLILMLRADSARSPLTKFKKKSVQQYNSTCVSALTGLVPLKWHMGCSEYQHPLGVNPMLPHSLLFYLATKQSCGWGLENPLCSHCFLSIFDNSSLRKYSGQELLQF